MPKGSLRYHDHTGKRFGCWVLLSRDFDAGYPTGWICQCDCGTKKTVNIASLLRGGSKSCGCKRKPPEKQYTHKMSKTKLYKIWTSMKQRCSSPNNIAYPYYGGRGISVCKSWQNFSNFLEDMGLPKKGETLDRIDTNGNYCKENCRWTDRKTQTRNRRKNRNNTSGTAGVTYSKEKKKWCVRIGVDYKTIHGRYCNTLEEAILLRKELEQKLWSDSIEAKT